MIIGARVRMTEVSSVGFCVGFLIIGKSGTVREEASVVAVASVRRPITDRKKVVR